MKTKLSRMQNVDEIHIEIDTLSTTPHGVQTLKNRYAKMMDRFAKEKERNEQYENEFFKKLQPSLERIQKLKSEIAKVAKASEEQEFHLQRQKDLANRIKAQKETILSQEEIIKNLTYSVKAQTKEGPQMSHDNEVRVNDMRYKRARL